MSFKQEYSLKDKIILIDPYIHKQTKFSRKEFLDRVQNVEQLRTSLNKNYVSFYITSMYEYQNLNNFHRIINKAIFDKEHYSYTFAIGIDKKLYDWFKTTTIETIQRQIVCALTAAYVFQPGMRNILEGDLYLPLLNEVENLVNREYDNYILPDLTFPDVFRDGFEAKHHEYETRKESCLTKYLEVCNNYFGSDPPEIFESPFEFKQSEGWGLNKNLNFEFVEGYFTKLDWERIVLKGGRDSLYRVESQKELWFKWKHVFANFDHIKNHEYTFFLDDKLPINQATYKRDSISKKLRLQVFERDDYKCKKCGKTSSLQIDHIVPVALGGPTILDNLQVLCEKCNKSKGIKIE